MKAARQGPVGRDSQSDLETPHHNAGLPADWDPSIFFHGRWTAKDAPAAARNPAPSLLKRAAALVGLVSFCFALAFLYEWMHAQWHDGLGVALSQLSAASLVLALGLTLIGYAVMTGYDFIALVSVSRTLPVTTVARTSFIANAFGNNFGNMLLTGSAVRYWLYTSAGVPAVGIIRIMVFCSSAFWLGFLLLGSLDFLAFPAPLPSILHWAGTTTRPLGIVFLTILITILTVFVWGNRRAPAAANAPLPTLVQAVQLIMIALLDLCLMTSVLYVLLNQVMDISFSHCLSTVLVALAVVNLSLVPGGLGVFEATLVMQLTQAAPAPALAGVLLTFRAIYYVLPMILALMLVVPSSSKSVYRSSRAAKALSEQWFLRVASQAVATIVFVAGAVLLFSGAIPASSGRFDALERVLALPFIDSSHFIASLAGAVLLLLAHALQRRLDGGWQLAFLLFGAGALLSIFKGGDVEEATLLTLACLGLLPLRKQFYRKSALMGERFTRPWAAAIAIVLVASVLLVLFALTQTPDAGLPWWNSALHPVVPRSQSVGVGATALTALFALYRLLRPVRPPLLVPGTADLERARAIAEHSVATYANLALRGDKALLFSPAGDAFLMYGRRGRCWVAMGEPVGAEESARALLWQFYNLCDRFDGWCVLFEVGEKWRSQYTELGLTLTPLGEEARVALAGFSLASPKRKKLREVRARLLRRGYSFHILSRDEVEAALPTLAHVSDTWLAAKNTAEKEFSDASFDSRYLTRFPVAVVRSGQEIVAFANLWLGADKEELSVDLMRHLPTAANGTMDLLFCELMLWGRSEGYQWCNLGMTPLSNLAAQGRGRLWPYVGTLIYQHQKHFYNFLGLRHFKEKFGPVWRPLYLASPGGLALPAILLDVTALVAGSLSGIVSKRP
jgi:phosphatidylglycerol lysyltransferase